MSRRGVLAQPETAHYVCAQAAPDHAPLDELADQEQLLTLLERVRLVYQARVYAYALRPQAVHLALQLMPTHHLGDQALQARWRSLAGRSIVASERLRHRLGSLAGFMQTLLQRAARAWNTRHQRRGSVWAPRFRSVVLADDCAVLAATTWIERRMGVGATTSRGRHDAPGTVTLAPPPVRLGPREFLFPTDEAPPGCSPPAPGEAEQALARFAQSCSSAAVEAHGRALAHGWALGRPESLAGVLAGLARSGGRGRSRRLRDLEDELGLCGVWG